MKKKIQVYLAGSMFCEADRMYNKYLAEQIREKFKNKIDLYVPQENVLINDKTKCADSKAIFWGDFSRLQKCDILIARIDGDVPPSGTSAEIGIMSQRIQTIRKLNAHYTECLPKNPAIYCLPEPTIIGLCTDSRNPKTTYLESKNELMKNENIESQYCYFNLFTIGCIKANGTLVTFCDSLLKELETQILNKLGE